MAYTGCRRSKGQKRDLGTHGKTRDGQRHVCVTDIAVTDVGLTVAGFTNTPNEQP